MKKLSLLCAAALSSTLMLAANASNTQNYYIGTQYNLPVAIHTTLDGKKSSTKQSFPNIDVALGMKINDYLRAEFAPGYRSFKYSHTSTDGGTRTQDTIKRLGIYKLMVNGYVDAPKVADIFTPYVMAGIGYAHIKKGKFESLYSDPGSSSLSNTTFSGNNFAWQSGVGVSTAITNKLSMDVGVVYANYGRVKFADPTLVSDKKSTKLSDVEAFVGFKYHF